MTWQENIRRWRELPIARKLQIRWEAIPLDVAQSMAFEREPVPVERIRETLARIEPPDLLKPPGARSPTRSERPFWRIASLGSRHRSSKRNSIQPRWTINSCSTCTAASPKPSPTNPLMPTITLDGRVTDRQTNISVPERHIARVHI